MPLEAARSVYAQASRTLDLRGNDAVRIDAIQAHVGARSVALRISNPAHAGRGTLMWIHGGGFCLGSAAGTDALCAMFASVLGMRDVSVDYRLAPEHALPAALEDVRTAIDWCGLRFPDEPLCLGGESAGATLAVAASREAVGETAPPRLLLCYPLAGPLVKSESMARYAHGHYLSVADLEWMHALSGYEADPSLHLLAPTAGFTAGRTMVLLAGRDPLFDQGIALASRLRAHGAEVTEIQLSDLVHGFVHMGGMVPFVKEVHAEMMNFVRESMM